MRNVLVSAYYEIPSKFDHAFYLAHIRRFFESVDYKQQDVVFFTSHKFFLEISDIQGIENVHFVLSDFIQLFYGKSQDFWTKHAELDIEHHSPQLAAIWCEKTNFVLRSTGLFPNRNCYIWIDAGCIRDELHADVFRTFGSRFDFQPNDTKLHVMQINNNVEFQSFYTGLDQCIAGAIMFGTKHAWKQHSQNYTRQLSKYDLSGKCASKDQHIIQSCANMNPNHYTLHKLEENEVIVNKWFFFLQIL